jgi:hypothetical protein
MTDLEVEKHPGYSRGLKEISILLDKTRLIRDALSYEGLTPLSRLAKQ